MKLQDAFTICAVLRELLARSRRQGQQLTQIITQQESLMTAFDEIKQSQDQDLQEGRETAAAGQAAIDRLTAAVTTLADKVAQLEAGSVTPEQVTEIQAASAAAKEQSDAVQAAFDATGQ